MTDLLTAATRYVEAGWTPIPVPARSKAPNFQTWQEFRIGDREQLPRLFSNGGNVGLLLGSASHNLVDVDLDCPEAIVIGDRYLPATDMIHGRPGKPCSHWWYICDPLPDTRRYKDPDGTVICELRSTGGQTIVPPSLHESGEQLAWETLGGPAALPGSYLAGEVAKVAAGALLARNWPVKGGRHDLVMALSGALLRHGWDVESVAQFVVDAGRAAGDNELADRERAARDTAERLRRQQPATGIPTLIGIVGERVVDRFCEWLGISNREEQPALVVQPNGAKPVVMPDPIDFDATRRGYQEILNRATLDTNELPFWLMRLVKHVAPYTPMFDDDWSITMALPFWSSLWPQVHIQNLNLAVWALGINVQGIGKNVATDEYLRIVRAVIGRSTQQPMVLYTSGTPEGMWDRLAGDNRQMLCYHAEFAGFLKLLSRDHMLSAREALCDLYDGRPVGHLRAQKNGVEISDPHVSVAATVTPVAIRNWGSIEDLLNGYLSRFTIVASNARQISPDEHPGRDDYRRKEVVEALSEHLLQLRDVRHARWLESNHQDPPLLFRYREHLGMNSGEVIDLDESFDDFTMPGGRFIARAKKIATLLELAEHRPNLTDDRRTVYIRPEHLDNAIRIVQRGRAYTMRLQSWIAQSSDYDLGQRILRVLAQSRDGRTQRDLCRLLTAKAFDVRIALELLAGAGQVTSQKTGKTERWVIGGAE